jgi:hypothetical protein
VSLTDQTAEGYHTIVLKAVDDRGGISAPVSRSLDDNYSLARALLTTPPA